MKVRRFYVTIKSISATFNTPPMKTALISLPVLLILLTQPLKGQYPSEASEPRFQPRIGLTYQFHTMRIPLSEDGQGYSSRSHFPGMEVGFTLLSKKPAGWEFDYRNSFLAELAFYELADETANPYTGIMSDIVDRTICHGFLGVIRAGRPLIITPGRSLIAGFILSDKVIFGTLDFPTFSYTGIGEDSHTMEGFHLTPGVFASFSLQYPAGMTLSVDASVAQSLFNVHQFDREAVYENFVLPLFTELQVKAQFNNGIYLRTGGLMGVSFIRLPGAARVSGAVGYTFRYR